MHLKLKTRTVIVGGGLSGLYAANLLEKQAQDYLLIEARDRFGGRIMSKGVEDTTSGAVDLGPSWYWPNVNPLISALADELGIKGYQQFGEGHYLVEKARGAPPQALQLGYDIMPDTYRLEGGMQALIEGLLKKIPEQKRVTQFTLREVVKKSDNTYQLNGESTDGVNVIDADRIVFAMPLRLVARSIAFTPPLSPELYDAFNGTETWMAAHAKAVFIYDKPFWRENGFSGSASSRVGPLVEIHDASPEINGETPHGAIMGFMGVNGAARKTAGRETLIALSQQQLVRLFGEEASKPIAVHYMDWFQETLTATKDDMAAMHGLYMSAKRDPTHPQLFFAGTEASPAFGGYLEGALDAASRAVDILMKESSDAI